MSGIKVGFLDFSMCMCARSRRRTFLVCCESCSHLPPFWHSVMCCGLPVGVHLHISQTLCITAFCLLSEFDSLRLLWSLGMSQKWRAHMCIGFNDQILIEVSIHYLKHKIMGFKFCCNIRTLDFGLSYKVLVIIIFRKNN